MGISQQPSRVTMPRVEKPHPSILDFLDQRFPRVGRDIWRQRILDAKVLDDAGDPIDLQSPYAAQKRIFYFREMTQEPSIPLEEQILFQSDELLVACKPPFLPVIPGGPYVNECLLNRLRRKTGNSDLVPIHRIDRETSGLVLFSQNRQTRGLYGGLFSAGTIEKSYEALCRLDTRPRESQWTVENRLIKDQTWFRMQVAPGPVNARSRIRLMDFRDDRAHFHLSPISGKQHQLRVHMSALGFPILNDRYYPELLPQQPDDLDNPLQLIARRVKFIDPVSGNEMEFESERRLLW